MLYRCINKTLLMLDLGCLVVGSGSKIRKGLGASFATQVFGGSREGNLHAPYCPHRPRATPIPLTGSVLPLSANELSIGWCGVILEKIRGLPM